MALFPTKIALKQDVWSKARCPDGIICKREWSSFTCNLLFSVGTWILTGSFAINSQMVKMNCPINYTSYCIQFGFTHGSFEIVIFKTNEPACLSGWTAIKNSSKRLRGENKPREVKKKLLWLLRKIYESHCHIIIISTLVFLTKKSISFPFQFLPNRILLFIDEGQGGKNLFCVLNRSESFIFQWCIRREIFYFELKWNQSLFGDLEEIKSSC